MALNKTHRVLIADDHFALRSGLRAVIERMPGWEVCGEAATGREAVEMTRLTAPSIVVMDAAMPDLSGVEATRQIRRLFPHVEVLVFTASEQDELVREVFEAGARGMLLKSGPISEFRAALQTLAEHKPYWTAHVSEIILRNYKGNTESEAPVAGATELTPREVKVIELLANGNSNKDTADLLEISVKTVESHRANVMHKMRFKSFSELVRYAVRTNLVSK